MSAFLCSDYHLSYIIQAGTDFRAWINLEIGWDYLASDKAQHAFECLKRENLVSVNYRYKEKSPELSKNLGFRCYVSRPIDPIQALKAIRCYEYQSCEHPTWEASLAKKICSEVYAACIAHLPGYEQAEWEINEPQKVGIKTN